MAKMHDHDAIIIGGGPAGATIARLLAKEGKDVLVIDKRKEIGVPVRCGEALGISELTKERIGLPRHVYSTKVRGTKLIGPSGKSITWMAEDEPGWILERKFFDKWLCELAVEKGAKVKTYTRAIGILKDGKGKPCGIKASHGGRDAQEIRAPLVISAEGMESLMAREMGFKTVHSLYDVDTCYEYEMKPYDHENLIEIYFSNKLAPRGYVWIFPKEGRKANVGIGIGANLETGKKLGGMKGADPKEYLERFVSGHPQLKDASTLLDFGGVISVGAPINEFVKDNCMVIGTAAKQVDPIHGGGIALAIESGYYAANAALEAFRRKDFGRPVLFEHYEKPWREKVGKGLGSRLALRKVTEKLSDDDLDHIFNSLQGDDLPKLMDGDFPPVVAKVLAGRPQLLGVLSALLPLGKK
jgi:digeranylgeranylglycerophospholipid reductase